MEETQSKQSNSLLNVSRYDSQDETSAVAGTSEGTVIQFQFLSAVLGKEEKEWVRTRTFKNHTHDVRAVLEINTAIVSGGLVTTLKVLHVMKYMIFITM